MVTPEGQKGAADLFPRDERLFTDLYLYELSPVVDGPDGQRVDVLPKNLL